jgi:hypothetical protein
LYSLKQEPSKFNEEKVLEWARVDYYIQTI